MSVNGVKIFSPAVLLIMSMLLGCASKEELAQRQSQLFQTGISQTQPAELVDNSIEVKTTKGIVAITPTIVSYQPAQFEDPFESINRPIFAFNHVAYTWVLTPMAKGYTALMPDPAEAAVSQFFSNLREPLNAINHGLQADGGKTVSSLGRFLINSTIGILGFFDPAKAWFGIEPHRATLNETLTSWDVDYGAYIVLPLLGQSDVRNGLSTLTETTFAPVTFMTESPETLYLQTYDGFHEFAPRAESYETLYKKSDDPYLFFRNMYMQSVLRNKQYQEHVSDEQAKPASSVTKQAQGKVNE